MEFTSGILFTKSSPYGIFFRGPVFRMESGEWVIKIKEKMIIAATPRVTWSKKCKVSQPSAPSPHVESVKNDQTQLQITSPWPSLASLTGMRDVRRGWFGRFGDCGGGRCAVGSGYNRVSSGARRRQHCRLCSCGRVCYCYPTPTISILLASLTAHLFSRSTWKFK